MASRILLDFDYPRAGLRLCVLQIHADQIQLQSQRRQVLAHGVVEKPGNHVALELLGLEGAQHGVAQFLIGGAPGSDFAAHAAGVANLPAEADGKHGEPQMALPRRSRSTTVSPSRARAKRSRHTLASSGGRASAAGRPASSEAGFPKMEAGSP
jgi:hypothetical protein